MSGRTRPENEPSSLDRRCRACDRDGCLPGAPLAWLDSRLGVASFASVIAERSDT
jgi:hypothetical protein